MAGLHLPHTLDLYAAGTTSGSGATPLRAGAAGWFETVSPGKRVFMQPVSESEMVTLWLDIALRNVIADGLVVYWRERATWWTVRGTPEIFETAGAAHIEATLAANVRDGFFPVPPAP